MNRAAIVVLALALTGCERGCLSTWLRDHAGGGSGPVGSGGPGPGALFSGTDCSDGLLRCTAGRVESSRLGHLPHPCGDPASPERGPGCVCPWDVVASCPSGCAVEGAEVLGGADAGSQLCRPRDAVTRPSLSTDEPIAELCTAEGVACVGGRIRACDGPAIAARIVAVCMYGCETAVALPPGEGLVTDGAASILCRRAHAERQ